MSNPNDFFIRNGVLVKYNGTDTDITIPLGVTSIGIEAFYECRRLQRVTISESVTSIFNAAFHRCENLQNITFPDSVTSIGGAAFYECKNLQSVTIPDCVTEIGGSAFYGCASLQSVTIPAGITSIGDHVFHGCENLQNISIPDTVTNIGQSALYGCKSLQSVTLPKGVTSIGDQAFQGCENLQDITIPDSVTSIGHSAFSWCKSLHSITIPGSVISIEERTFADCSKLRSVTIQDGVISIGDSAFSRCRRLKNLQLPTSVKSFGSDVFSECALLADQNGFLCANGLLIDYFGPGGNIVVPDGVQIIYGSEYHSIFEHKHDLKNVYLPNSLREIMGPAFYGCDIEELRIPLVAVNGNIFGPSGKTVVLKVFRPGKEDVRVVASFRKQYWSQTWSYPEDYLLPLSEDAIPVYDKLVLSGAYDGFHMNENGRVRAALWRLTDHEFPIANELRGDFADFLVSKISKVVKYAEEDIVPAYIRSLIDIGAVNESNIKKIKSALMKSVLPEIQALADDLTATTTLSTPTQEVDTNKAVEPRFIQRIKKLNASGVLLKYGVETIPEVLSADNSGFAPAEYFKLILAEYLCQAKKESIAFAGLADEAALKLDKASLETALLDLYRKCQKDNQQLALLLPLFRYASGKTVRDVYPELRRVKWKEKYANRALLLSETREAMLYADKKGFLPQYAKMRGFDEDTLRDQYLSNVGLDENSGKAYDLGNQIVTARLQMDLSFLFELPGGKTAKSLPKKGADEAKYAAAKADFDEMRKSVKKILKNRADRLFEDFLSGRACESANWQTVYLNNPLLRKAASIIVWVQDRNTFTLTENGVINSKELPYSITDEPIRVAHPLEMEPEDTKAWEKYFNAHGLKQPFAQIWEPVRHEKEIGEFRYFECMIPYYRFLGQEKHGITVTDEDYHNDIQITLKDVNAHIERIDWERHSISPEHCFEIKSFSFKEYTRQVNHLVAYFDRVTVWDRVRKDDVTVADLLPGFTLAQITEFIAAAQEANAANVLALLLDYKNTHFADFDPMDEFTLDW